MLGIALDRPCGEIVGQCLEDGLVLNVTADTVVRLLPPMIYTRAHADQLMSILVPRIRALLSKPAPA
jgi:acetylornithine/N-succinyldiaminopimelate aminotransferase